MSAISPKQKKILAASAFVIIAGLLIGTTIYQTYYSNPVKGLPKFNQIDQFTLPSADGTNYTYVPSASKVTIVSWIYTKCPGTQGCALVTANMMELKTRVENANLQDSVQFVSIDFDYINDTMANVQAYTADRSINVTAWKFLLGDKNQTDALADEFNFYFAVNNATATPKSTNATLTLSHGDGSVPEPYIHTLSTYVIDRSGNVRVLLVGTAWDFIHIINVIKFLRSPNWNST